MPFPSTSLRACASTPIRVRPHRVQRLYSVFVIRAQPPASQSNTARPLASFGRSHTVPGSANSPGTASASISSGIRTKAVGRISHTRCRRISLPCACNARCRASLQRGFLSPMLLSWLNELRATVHTHCQGTSFTNALSVTEWAGTFFDLLASKQDERHQQSR
jgi:hypothetical protein